MEIVFTAKAQFALERREYETFWRQEGRRIKATFTSISGLPFTESTIRAIVGTGDKTGSNNAGRSVNDPMRFRANSRSKGGTLLHELGHRLLLEHGVREKIPGDDHFVLDLFLFDVWRETFGLAAAKARVAYEKSFPDPTFAPAWESVLKLSRTERQKKLHQLFRKYAVTGSHSLRQTEK